MGGRSKIMHWEDKYKSDLEKSGRDESMLKALELLREKHLAPGIIVETGCQRMINDIGGGQSTLIFADFCKEFNYHLFTVDNNPDAMEVAIDVTKEFEAFVSYVVNDSVLFLAGFNQKIDFLYLDSMDCPEYDSPTSSRLIASQVHQYIEMETALSKLSDDPVILLDDNLFDNGGKTRLTKFLLKERGFSEIVSGKQSLWVKS